jgi:hypothetical protein
MKRILFILLLFPLIASAQIGRFPFYTAPVVAEAPPAGDNMISNGEFADTTDWNEQSAGFTIADGVLSYTGTAVAVCAQTAEHMVDSLQYSTDYTFTMYVVSSSPGLYFRLRTATNVNLAGGANYTTGTVTLNFTTPASPAMRGIQLYVWGDADGTIDNVTLNPAE